jgi:NTP pyrophosphatase (non-canonical NTP hydrolase)
MSDIDSIKHVLLQFRDERNWKQFHTLKNLIVSLNLEAAELLELTQWKSDAEIDELASTDEFQRSIQEECADVFLYLLLISDHVGFDLVDAARNKIKTNALRYPVKLSYGSAKKYTELDHIQGALPDTKEKPPR